MLEFAPSQNYPEDKKFSSQNYPHLKIILEVDNYHLKIILKLRICHVSKLSSSQNYPEDKNYLLKIILVSKLSWRLEIITSKLSQSHSYS